MDLEHESRLSKVEARSQSNTHRIDKLEEHTEAINRLANNMGLMAQQQKQTAETVDKLDSKVTALEQKPGKRWDGIVDKLTWALVAAVLGFLLAQIGL